MHDDAEPPASGLDSGRGVLLVILGLALALRIPNLGESIWFDEYLTSSASIGKVSLLLKTMYGDIHPPAYFCLMYAWVNVFGDGEIALRTPPLLFGLGTIWLTFGFARSFVGVTGAAMAALFLALSPVHIWYSQEARPYSAMMFVVLGAVTCFVRLQRGDDRRRIVVAFPLFVGAAVFMNYYLANFALAMAGLALLPGTRRRATVLWSCGVPLALMAGYVALKIFTQEFLSAMYYLRSFTPAEGWALFFNWFLCGNVFSPVHEPPATGALIARTALQVCAVIVAGCGIAAVLRRRDGWHLLAFMLVLPAFLMALPWVGLTNTYIERAALPALPFFAVVIGAGVATLARGRGWLVGGAWVLLQLVVLVAYFAQPSMWTVYRPNPDWRAAAAYLGEEIDRGAAGRRIYTQYPSPEPLNYYDPRIDEAARFEVNEDRMRRLLTRTESAFGKGLVHDVVAGLIEDFEADKREAAATMQVTIYQLGRHDPLAASRAERGDGVFYVVRQGTRRFGDPAVERLLRSERLELLETRALRWLTVYAFRYRQP